MTWTVKIRGASSQPLRQDFLCADCGPFYADTARDATEAPCPDCGKPAPWVMSTPFANVRHAEVVRGGVQAQERPTWLSTRELGNGMPKAEWQAKRDKALQEQRHKESKEFSRFVKGVT